MLESYKGPNSQSISLIARQIVSNTLVICIVTSHFTYDWFAVEKQIILASCEVGRRVVF